MYGSFFKKSGGSLILLVLRRYATDCILVFFHSFKTKLCGTLSDLKEDKIFFSYKFQAIADLG